VIPVIEHPGWLPLLGAAGAAALLAWAWAAQRVGGRAIRLLGPAGTALGRSSLRDGLLVAAGGLVAIGLLGPRIGHETVLRGATGADVVLLLDVSRSMDAADTAPSRLARAVATAGGLLEGLDRDDRIALAGFAGRGVLLSPLTPDRDALATMLRHLDSGLIRPGGSALSSGVAAALEAFEPDRFRPRVVVVLSDGEIGDPAGETGADLARRARARVVGVGIGSEVGAPVPDRGGPLRDASGRTVSSRRRMATLERLAKATDGAALAADAWGTVAIDALISSIDRDVDAASKVVREAGDETGARGDDDLPADGRRVPVAMAWPFATAAMGMLLFEALAPRGARPPSRWRSRRRSLRASALAALVLLFATAFASPTSRSPDDADREAAGRIRLALWYAEAGDTARASAELATVAVVSADPALAGLAEYDLGVLALERGDLEAARDHFFAALAHAPRDRRARFNAEWTLRALAARDASHESAGQARHDEKDARGPAPDDPAHAPRTADTRAADGDAPGDPAEERATTASRSGGETGADGATTLDATTRARWLDRVEDDPRRAMRLRARAVGEAAPARPRMTW
jgi:Tfp pilus assembly protein PilF